MGRTRVCKNEPLWDYVIAAIGSGADGGLICQVPRKQKKPGKPIISGFPGIDTKPALRFGRLVLYERLFLNMV